ncbi:glycosyltransferase family A protein [Myroides sp. C15-4]|uniref:glycosyltransferase family A protein n=1 Tax=Myroides sp. C15-4 TaxID=3400532 RepID=UPI003D2F76F6
MNIGKVNKLVVQPLISTMNRDNFDFLLEMNLGESYGIVNQGKFSASFFSYNEKGKFIYNSKDKGLSKSRNKAVSLAKGDIILLCDDDVIYKANYSEIVNKAYSKIPDADIIVFKGISTNLERQFHNFGDDIKKMNFRDTLQCSSVLVSCKLKSIVSNEIMFDNRFGSGSGMYSSGEENIFLKDCLTRKLKIYYYPEVILTKKFSNSLWFRGFTKEYFISKGALFKKLLGYKCYLGIFFFAVKKHSKYKSSVNFYKAIIYMLKGCNQL